MSDLDGLDVFVAICEAGSIAGAGRALGIPRATLSRQLARLEADLGVRLLHRTTRRLIRSPAGEELYRRARRIVDEASQARDAIRRRDGRPRGLVRLSLPPHFDAALAPALTRFLEAFPEVTLEVTAEARHIDLVREGYDVALRAGRTVEPDVVSRRLATTRLRAWATPAYLDARGRPRHPDDLVDHDCVRGLDQGRTPSEHWPLLDGGTVPVGGRLITSSMVLAAVAAHSGQGIALLPEPLAASTRLEPVLHHQVGADSDISIVFVERAWMLPRVRAMVDHLSTEVPPLLTRPELLAFTRPGPDAADAGAPRS